MGETAEIAKLLIDLSPQIEKLVSELISLRARRGRLFLVGLGGSAANCSHAVNDFRRLCGIDASTPVDNSALLTATANDDGWNSIFASLGSGGDALLILSVGGGTDTVSLPIVSAVNTAKTKGMRILGIVGRDGGYTKYQGDTVIVIPTVNPERVTPHTEAFQMVVLHCIVSHPDLQIRKTVW
jgi:D-sedoheptulose 7-phosphate isomerase